MRKLLLSLSVFLAALGFAMPVLLQGSASIPEAPAPAPSATLTADGDDDSSGDTTEDELTTLKNSTIKLVKYLNSIDGLLPQPDGTTTPTSEDGSLPEPNANSVAATAVSAIESATDADAVNAAKVTFLQNVQQVNVSIQTVAGNYLSLHKANGATGSAQPHTHPTFGFTCIWHLKWSDDTGTNKKGLHIISHYNKAEGDSSNEGIGNAGGGLMDHGFTPFWEEIEVDGEKKEGIAFRNYTDAGWLSSKGTDSNYPNQTGVQNTIDETTVWTIERVYVPASIEIVNIDPKTLLVGKTLTITQDNLKFTSEVEGKDVTPGLTGVNWSSSNNSIATVEGQDGFETSVPGDDNPNGYKTGVVTGVAKGTVTITAQSPMHDTQVEGTSPSATLDLTVEDPTLTVDLTAATIAPAVDGFAITAGEDDAAATCSVPYSEEEQTITIPVTRNDFASDALTLTEGLTITEGENDTQNITITIDAKAEPTGDEAKSYTITTGEGDAAVTLFALDVTIEAAVLESLTASIPAATKMVENATERTVTLSVVPTPAIYVVKTEQLTVKIGETACEVAAGDDDNTFTVTIPEGVAVGEQTLSVSFKADDSASEIAATATADGTLTLEITKAPLTALTASVTDAIIFTTAAGDARNITVTLTPDPTAYDLSVGKAIVELVAETSTQADGEEEATTGLDITKGEDGSFTVTYAVPTDQAVGSYNVKVTYTEGEGDNVVTKDATATGTITIATPAITSIAYKDVTDNAIALTIAKGATEITKDIVIEAVPEGAVFTGKTVTFTAAVAEGETEPENTDGISATIKTVDGQAANQLTFTITASVAGTYTLTPAIEDATGLTLPALTVTVTQAEKDLVVASVTAATVEPITLTQTAADTYTAEGEVTFTVTIGDDSETLTESNLEVTATGVTQGTVTLTAPESGNDYTVKVPFTATAATTEEAPATIKLAITGLAEGAEAKEATASITVNAPALTIESITAPAAAEVEAEAENLTAAFTVTTAEGSAWPTAADFTATATGVTVAETGAVSVSGEGTAWTVTVAYTATEPTAEDTPATIVLSAGDKTATASITVKAAETPVDPDKTVVTATFGTPAASTLEAGESTTATVTLAVADGESPTADALTVTVSPADKGVTATIAETDGEITVTVTAAAENVTSGDYTIAIAPKAADADFTISGTPLTIKVNGTVEPEPTPGDLPVTKPEQPENPVVGAPEVKIDGTEMTINFNASPADADGEPAEAVMTVALPAAEGADLDQLEAVVEGNAEVTISETGININASKAEIGETIHIIIRKKQAEAPETQSLALLAEGEEEETPVAPTEPTEPTDDDIVMTIDVTIYGVEFTTAPATATLGADGSVEVTFATNDATPDDATVDLTVEGPAEATVADGKITFAQAGTYTVTAKAGDNYVATTKITVKNAPTVTGIEAVNADAAAGNAAIYDLQGRRLTRVNAAGIYIVNGVKTLVR